MTMGCNGARPHHWVIATPDGRRELPGTCTGCGATRMFALPTATYDYREVMTDIARPRPDPDGYRFYGLGRRQWGDE